MFNKTANSSPSVSETLSTLSLLLFFVIAMTVLSTWLTSVAKAQTSTTQTSAVISPALANDPATLAAAAEQGSRRFAYTGELLLETARTADESSPISYTGWYKFTGSATHAPTAITGMIRLGYTREYTYERADGTNGDLDNPILTLSKSFLHGQHYDFAALDSVSLALIGSLPGGREAERRTFMGSSGVLLTGSKALGRFTIQQTFGYSRGFYRYDIRDDGTVNSPDAFKTLTLVNYNLTDRLSLGGLFNYSYAISFQGIGRGTQLGAVTVDYALTENIAASIGVMSERATIEPDGQSDRIRVYAPEAAQYFADVILKL